MNKEATVKMIKRIIKYVLIIGLLYYVWDRWDVWFELRTEEAYTVEEQPHRLFLMLGEDPTSRAVSWRCGTVAQPSELWYVDTAKPTDTIRITARDTLVTTLGGKAVYYGAEMHNLLSNNHYRYAIANRGKVASPWHEFEITNPDAPFSFLYLGDVHNCHTYPVNKESIYPRIDSLNPDVLCWLYIGDLIDKRLERDWTEYFHHIDTLSAVMPQLITPGNHEQQKGILRNLDERWEAINAYPKNGPEGATRYGRAFHYGNLFILSLTTYELPNPRVLIEQYEWAEEQLKNASEPWKIVAIHHPAFSVAQHRFSPLSRYLFRPLFEKYGVAMIMQGHDHVYGRRSAIEDDPTAAPLYVVSNLSLKQYVPNLDRHFDRIGVDIRLYQRINVSADTLTYAAYTLEQELYDSVTIVRNNDAITLQPYAGLPQEHIGIPNRIKGKGDEAIKEFLEEVKEKRP